MALDSHIEKVLWNAGQISDRVADLAAEITADFSPDSPAPILIGVATGAFVFLADLAREIKLPISVDFIRADSYGSGTESSGAPKVSLDLKIDVKGKHVIVVEDIVDTGNTLASLIRELEWKGASAVSVCAFLDKPARRKVQFQVLLRLVQCEDYFVVGYGMDFAELYRNLPYVGVLKPEFYR
ncbi:Hypoxanthine-guanine phosphoribosyltransferase [Linum perenne]